MAIAYNNLAGVYSSIKDFETSLRYFKKAEHLKKSYDLKGVSSSMINIGITYAAQDQFTKALTIYDSLYDSCRPNCSDDQVREVLSARMFAFFTLEQYENA
ncbi:tetratricopeptide repeat protein, partial [Fulvivirga aurantia]|uniref:tetratricopeptide repeat protein n=1 Tax=Fulvivirga aurantia TaxID=2529383 RepID=UPI003CCCC28F